MRFSVKDSSQPVTRSDLLVLFGTEGSRPALPRGLEVPAHSLEEFKGEFRQARLTDAEGGPARRVLLLGLGKADELDLERMRRAAGLAVRTARADKRDRITLWLGPRLDKELGKPELDPASVGQALAEGALMATYAQGKLKKEPKPGLAALVLQGAGAAFRKGAGRGRVLAEANAFARDLQDAPGNLMRPRDLAAAARRVAAKSERIRYKALDEAAMKKLGMGSLLSVSRGSQEPACLIHLTYRPKGRSKGRIAFVGKGLTFDAGGISLKPAAKMHEMKYDMSGGAAVLGVFHALAALDVPFEVHGIVPASENLPDGKANKPGDVVTAMNGLTIEVLNTDAEGRLILADALAYTCAKVKPDTIVDLATLTGAVVVALGHELSGVITPTDELARALVRAGEASGERVWRLPLLDCHKEHMKGTMGDLRNINAGQGAGSTAGAAFLANFVDGADWAHLDIAGTAWGAEERDYVGGEGGTGVGVRLLLQYLEDRRRT